MVYKFTNRAEKAIEMAQEIAAELGHNYVGTEHLLCGLDVNGQKQFGRADYQKSWNNAYSGANGSAVQSANRTLSHTGRSGRVAANSGDRATIQAGGQAASSRREGVVNSGSYQRGQGQSGK